MNNLSYYYQKQLDALKHAEEYIESRKVKVSTILIISFLDYAIPNYIKLPLNELFIINQRALYFLELIKMKDLKHHSPRIIKNKKGELFSPLPENSKFGTCILEQELLSVSETLGFWDFDKQYLLKAEIDLLQNFVSIYINEPIPGNILIQDFLETELSNTNYSLFFPKEISHEVLIERYARTGIRRIPYTKNGIKIIRLQTLDITGKETDIYIKPDQEDSQKIHQHNFTSFFSQEFFNYVLDQEDALNSFINSSLSLLKTHIQQIENGETNDLKINFQNSVNNLQLTFPVKKEIPPKKEVIKIFYIPISDRVGKTNSKEWNNIINKSEKREIKEIPTTDIAFIERNLTQNNESLQLPTLPLINENDSNKKKVDDEIQLENRNFPEESIELEQAEPKKSKHSGELVGDIMKISFLTYVAYIVLTIVIGVASVVSGLIVVILPIIIFYLIYRFFRDN